LRLRGYDIVHALTPEMDVYTPFLFQIR